MRSIRNEIGKGRAKTYFFWKKSIAKTYFFWKKSIAKKHYLFMRSIRNEIGKGSVVSHQSNNRKINFVIKLICAGISVTYTDSVSISASAVCFILDGI
jgi:hypothetical protein